MSEAPKGLCELRIGNFKAFADTQQIPIRRLTLIYGDNSAGKSSVIHSLLLVMGVGRWWTSAVADTGLRTGNEFSPGTIIGFIVEQLEFARAGDFEWKPVLLRG